ncbi:MAG: hypothetical protein ACFE95_23365 [Candidatus Hodarchaeota archaeon]
MFIKKTKEVEKEDRFKNVLKKIIESWDKDKASEENKWKFELTVNVNLIL